MRKFFIVVTAVTFVLFLSFGDYSHAGEVRDGFQAAKKIKSRFFTIYIEGGVNTVELASCLSVPPSIKAIIKDPTVNFHDSSLSGQLDIFFLAVSEILDIRLKSFECKIKICRDMKSLSKVAENLFGRSVNVAGFYISQINTLYIDAEHLNISILGHELSHAIQCNYFVIPPPEKIQEVLSGYVEFQLRKYTNTLPHKK